MLFDAFLVGWNTHILINGIWLYIYIVEYKQWDMTNNFWLVVEPYPPGKYDFVMFLQCYVYHSQSWVVYIYFLPTLIVINSDTTHILIFWSMVGLPINMWYWLVFEPYPSEKYDFVSWDDDIPNWMESHKSHVLNHQAVFVYLWSKHVATSTNTWWFRNGVFLNSGSTICRRCPDSDLRSLSSTYPL